MTSPCNRRTALQIVGSSATLALAGCAANQDSAESNASPSQTSTQTQKPITTDDFFDIIVDKQFTDNHPARIQATLTNTTETVITLITGVAPPFTDYLNAGGPNNRRLILVPDVSDSDPNPLVWRDEDDNPIPTAPEGGCWEVTEDVLIQQTQIAIGLNPGETVSQQYAVYGYQNESCLPSGDYRFVDNANIHRGPLSTESPKLGVTLGFTLTLNEEQSLSVKRREPTVTKHEE